MPRSKKRSTASGRTTPPTTATGSDGLDRTIGTTDIQLRALPNGRVALSFHVEGGKAEVVAKLMEWADVVKEFNI